MILFISSLTLLVNGETSEELTAEGINLHLASKNMDALSFLNQAIEIDPSNARAWRYKGNTLLDLEDYESAIIAFNKAIELNPKEAADSYRYLGYTYSYLNNYKEAMSSFEKASNLEPYDYYIWIMRAWALEKLENYDEAIIAYEKALTFPPDTSIYSDIGDNYKKMGDYQKALETYLKAIEMSPTDYEGYEGAGVIYEEMGEYQSAINIYDKCNLKIDGVESICSPSLQNTIDYQESNQESSMPSPTYDTTLLSGNSVSKDPPSSAVDVCDCSSDFYNCNDFPLPNGANSDECFNYCISQGKGDVHNFDRNNDGDACEPGFED